MIKTRLVLLAAALTAVLAACGPKAPEIDPNMIYTEVAETVAVEMIYTQVAATMLADAALTAQAQATPIPSATATPIQPPPTPTVALPAAPDTPTPGPDAGGEVLDRAVLTYQFPVDGQRFNPGSCFDAVWTFQNTGQTTWNANYSIRWLGYGQRYKAADSYPFETYADQKTVAPGEVVKITVPGLCAPAGQGNHIGPFCLYNSRLEEDLPDQCFYSTTVEIYIGTE